MFLWANCFMCSSWFYWNSFSLSKSNKRISVSDSDDLDCIILSSKNPLNLDCKETWPQYNSFFDRDLSPVYSNQMRNPNICGWSLEVVTVLRSVLTENFKIAQNWLVQLITFWPCDFTVFVLIMNGGLIFSMHGNEKKCLHLSYNFQWAAKIDCLPININSAGIIQHRFGRFHFWQNYILPWWTKAESCQLWQYLNEIILCWKEA